MNSINSSLQSIVEAQVSERIKIAKAVEAANKAFKETENRNQMLAKAAADVVSQIQKDLHKEQRDAKKAQQEAYATEMCSLGLSATVYPLETALVAVDQKMVTPVLSTVGNAAGHVTTVSKGIWDRVKLGFNTATK